MAMTPGRRAYAQIRIYRLTGKLNAITAEINQLAALGPVKFEVLERLMKARRSSLRALKRWQSILDKDTAGVL